MTDDQPLPAPLAGPFHVESDGDVLHAIVRDRLSRRAPTTLGVVEGSRPGGRGGRAHVAGWMRHRLAVDGPAGTLRSLASQSRQARRIARALLSERRDRARTEAGDRRFVDALVAAPVPDGGAQPEAGATIVSFGPAAPDAVDGQRLIVHLGWPSLPGRDGTIAALTHRDLDALCAVIEARGRVGGWATATPPLHEDDTPASIHRRLVAAAAELIGAVVDDPSLLRSDPPHRGVRSPLVDAAAVRRDVASSQLRDVIRARGRF